MSQEQENSDRDRVVEAIKRRSGELDDIAMTLAIESAGVAQAVDGLRKALDKVENCLNDGREAIRGTKGNGGHCLVDGAGCLASSLAGYHGFHFRLTSQASALSIVSAALGRTSALQCALAGVTENATQQGWPNKASQARKGTTF